MRIRLLGNAGLVFNIGSKKIMIDGLYRNLSKGFSDVPPRILKPMLNGVGEFSNIDYLLFTHDHPGNFNGEYLREYLNSNNNILTCLPDNKGIIKDFNRLGYNRIQNLTTNLHIRMRLDLEEDFTIDYFPVAHYGDRHKGEINICYIIGYNGYKVLVVGDGDYNMNYYEGMIEKREIHAIVVNPLFYNSSKGIELIEHYEIPNVIVYKIPFEKDDKNGFRRLVNTDMRKNEGKPFQTLAFMESRAGVWLK